MLRVLVFLPPLPQMIKLNQQFVLGISKSNRERDFNICFISGGRVTATVLAEIWGKWGFKVIQSVEKEIW